MTALSAPTDGVSTCDECGAGVESMSWPDLIRVGSRSDSVARDSVARSATPVLRPCGHWSTATWRSATAASVRAGALSAKRLDEDGDLTGPTLLVQSHHRSGVSFDLGEVSPELVALLSGGVLPPEPPGWVDPDAPEPVPFFEEARRAAEAECDRLGLRPSQVVLVPRFYGRPTMHLWVEGSPDRWTDADGWEHYAYRTACGKVHAYDLYHRDHSARSLVNWQSADARIAVLFARPCGACFR